jgi:flagellar basal body rod protein FlgC
MSGDGENLLSEKKREYHRKWKREHPMTEEQKKKKLISSHKNKCAICGKPIMNKSTYCPANGHFGENNSHWKGGKKKCHDYVYVWNPTHPNAANNGYVFEHRLVMETHLGRTLLPEEVVHHINGIPNDNRIENLMLFKNHSEHISLHNRSRKNV